MDQMTNIVWRDASNNVLASFAYGFNSALMITQKQASVTGRAWEEFYSLDGLDRLTGEKRVENVGTTTYDVGYTYDLVGNRTQKTRDGITVNYSYSNGCNRLTGWTAASTNDFLAMRQVAVTGTSTETVGTNSNLGQLFVSNSISGGKNTPAVSGKNFTVNALSMVDGQQFVIAAAGDVAGNVGYATNTVTFHLVTNAVYGADAAGCVTGMVYGGGGFTNTASLSWDGQYRLTAVSTNGVAVERHGYDPFGRRVWTWDGTATNWFVYDGPNVIAEVDATGALKKSYVWAGVDRLLALNIYSGSTTNTLLALTDHLGSVHALANAAGQIEESYRFDAFGRVLAVLDGGGLPLAKSAVGNSVLWQGKVYSWNTGLYFSRARWYSPDVGRFISADPIGISAGLNIWAYCNNNPVNFTDPTGLETEWFPFDRDVPPGTILTYRFDPASLNTVIADVVGKIWTSPNTAIGLVLGAANLPFGGSVTLGNNAIQFHTTYGNPAIGMGALTLGNVVLYSEGANPGMVWPTYDKQSEVCVGKHEEAHTYQYQLLGPFFGPAYLLGGGAFTAASPYEQAADLYGFGLGAWWPK